MNSHDKHMFREPTFTGSLLDRQAHGELFQADSVSAILSVSAVDRVIFDVDIDPALIKILGNIAAVHFALRMNKPVKGAGRPLSHEFLVAGPIEQGFTMSYIR